MPHPRPGRRIPHRRARTSRSPVLPREVRRSFSQESNFHFKLPVPALKFPDPLVIRRIGRNRLTRELFLVRLHPKAEGCIVHPELSRYLGDRQRRLDHSSGGLFLELRSIFFAFWHLIPFPSGKESYWIPVRKVRGTSVAQVHALLANAAATALSASAIETRA